MYLGYVFVVVLLFVYLCVGYLCLQFREDYFLLFSAVFFFVFIVFSSSLGIFRLYIFFQSVLFFRLYCFFSVFIVVDILFFIFIFPVFIGFFVVLFFYFYLLFLIFVRWLSLIVFSLRSFNLFQVDNLFFIIILAMYDRKKYIVLYDYWKKVFRVLVFGMIENSSTFFKI